MRSVSAALALLAALAPSMAPAQQAGARVGSFDSDGVRIRYVEQGAGSPVILIHGFSIDADFNWGFTGVFDSLAADHRVIALDVRGHGRSGKPHERTAYGEHLVQDVVNLMDHLQIPRAHVVGYSMGAGITLKFLVEHPDRTISAVLGGGGWNRANRPPAAVVQWGEGLVRAARGETTVADVIHIPGTPPHTPEIRAMLNANDARALLAVLGQMGEVTVTEEELRANRVPVLAIVGENDSLVMENVDRMEGVLRNLQVVRLPGADHLTALTHARFIPTIAWFVRPRGDRSPSGP